MVQYYIPRFFSIGFFEIKSINNIGVAFDEIVPQLYEHVVEN